MFRFRVNVLSDTAEQNQLKVSEVVSMAISHRSISCTTITIKGTSQK